jgi:hypothetical protein
MNELFYWKGLVSSIPISYTNHNVLAYKFLGNVTFLLLLEFLGIFH